jgi:integrase
VAIRWQWIDKNPAAGIERNAETKRRRYLSADELSRLLDALDRLEDREAANVIRILLLTGCRRGEALGMAWGQLDLATGVWTKQASETKQNRFHQTPLSQQASDLLREIRAESTGGPAVFAIGAARLSRQWAHVCRTAGLADCRLHDLRHSFASLLVSSGLSLPVIGALLGHSNPSTTARYAHLADAVTREATGRVGAIVGGATRLKVVANSD